MEALGGRLLVRIEISDAVIRNNRFRLLVEATFCEGIHLITGPVGSGKSSFALMASGAALPESGRVEYHGIKSKMLMMQFPEYHVTGHTVRSEIRSWGLEPESVLNDTNLLGMEDIPVHRLSRGQLKKLELGCVFAGRHDLIVFDEPYSSLDCPGKIKLSKLISERKTGICIICTHDLLQLPAVDCIWEIQAGRLVKLGSMPEAFGLWEHPPSILKQMAEKGVIPENIDPKSMERSVCRIQD